MASNDSSLSPLALPQELFHVLHTIEVSFDERRVIPWMSGHWHWSIYCSIIYLLIIYLGQKYMENKRPYDLRGAYCCWSAGVSLFSLYAVCRSYPIAYNIIHTGGFQHGACDITSYIGSSGAGIWAFLLPLSKLVQLFDTVFLILEKRVYILHWYHHFTVLIYSWYCYAYPISTGTCFGLVNYAVHVIMYGYHAIKSSGVSPPKYVTKSLTVLQIVQLSVAGIFFNYLAVRALLLNKTCAISFPHIVISLFLYVSYACLSTTTSRMLLDIASFLIRLVHKTTKLVARGVIKTSHTTRC